MPKKREKRPTPKGRKLAADAKRKLAAGQRKTDGEAPASRRKAAGGTARKPAGVGARPGAVGGAGRRAGGKKSAASASKAGVLLGLKALPSSQENALTLSAIGGHGDGLARLIAQSNPLTHVFSTDSSDPFLEDLQSLDEMQVDVSTTSFQDLSWYGSDLDLAPLPEVKSEHSLREAAALAHKMELFRSMSTEADALSDDCLVGSHNMAVDDRSATSARSMASSSAKLRIAAVDLEGLQLQPPIIISTSSLMGGTDTTTWDFPESPRTAVCSFARPKSAGLLSPAGNSGSASDVDAPTTDIEEKRQVTKKKTSQGRPAKPLTKTMDTSQHTPKQSTISLQSQKLKKKRVVKKDPNRQRSKPWTQEELTQFRILLQEDGASNWLSKAEKLGTGRTAKSLHTRWLRDEGRIVDRPRGANAKPDGQPDGEEISV